MQKVIKYVIFKTKWGYFGLAGTEYALCRTCLPRYSPERTKLHLLKTLLSKSRASSIWYRGSSIEHRLSAVAKAKAEVSFVRRPVLRSISEGGSAPVRRSESEGGRIEIDKAFFKTLQQQIIAYFEGVRIDFGLDVPVSLDGFSEFQKAALTECRKLRFGRIVTYGGLAKKLSRPAAARAVGNALAKNPLPLIIPCHRVIRSDGSLGGFSALGGLSLKKRLLAHERNYLLARRRLEKIRRSCLGQAHHGQHTDF